MYAYTIHCSKLFSSCRTNFNLYKARVKKNSNKFKQVTSASGLQPFPNLHWIAVPATNLCGIRSRGAWLLSTVSIEERVQASVGAVIVCCLVPIISTKVRPGPERDHLVWLHSDIGISILVQSTRNSLACYSRSEPVDIYVCQKPCACIVLRAICSYSYCTSSSVMRVRT